MIHPEDLNDHAASQELDTASKVLKFLSIAQCANKFDRVAGKDGAEVGRTNGEFGG